VYAMDDHVARLSSLYSELMTDRASIGPGAPLAAQRS
jgi:hypothetical protein